VPSSTEAKIFCAPDNSLFKNSWHSWLTRSANANAVAACFVFYKTGFKKRLSSKAGLKGFFKQFPN